MKVKRLAIAAALVPVVFVVVAWIAGTLLVAPFRRDVGSLPPDLKGEVVEFQSESGSQIHGWFLPGREGHGVIVIMHGVRACRLDMLDRARFLSQGGYAVLLFDFQAHGESSGQHITFGYLESRDAQAAVRFARARLPGEKIGVIGVSMGGAAMLLAEPPLTVDGVVLEQVYPTLHQAIGDRISMRLGRWSRVLTPLLSWQLRPRLGLSEEMLRPTDHAAKILCPKFFIGGSEDRHTTPVEVRKMFESAADPKELWIVPGAQHVDLSRFARTEYKNRVLDFFARCLAPSE
ncbi:MAG TPA: alpha/beta fold hydrolase [Chthoniobacterales bacterium]|jgi:fermentation-respiration switch protein FrsA (DUF1100 family)|nr:alpha/beta fold hydrolase [Chthoniobacterales bacterium]